MKVIYIADDGKEFDNEWDCMDYEWKLNHTHLNDIVFYDKDHNELKEIFLHDIYTITEKVVVPNKEALEDLHEFAEYTGFCCYYSIEDVGVWYFDEDIGDFKKGE